MAEPLPSLDLLSAEVRAERDAFTRHADAVDAKAGIILGFAGALVALQARGADATRIAGLVLAAASAAVAASVLWPQRFPTWQLRDLRDRYIRAEAAFTQLHVLDTGIVMVVQMKEQLDRKVGRLRWSIALLVAAAMAFVAGTLVRLGG